MLRGTGGFVLTITNSKYFILDGSAKAGLDYGIKVTATGGGPTAFVKIRGTSTKYTVKNIEIDGVWPSLTDNGIGLSLNDTQVPAGTFPYREDIVIENCYIHHTEGEGLYGGPNWASNEPPLRNITIRNCTVTDTGWDGIQGKSWIAGTNAIYGNTVTDCGKRTDGTQAQHHGISLASGKASIYNNTVKNSGEVGIQCYVQNGPPNTTAYETLTSDIYNNVVIRAGANATVGTDHGISVGRDDGVKPPVPTIRHNTVVDSEASGINVSTNIPSGVVRDNIVVDSGSSNIDAHAGITQTTNLTGAMAAAGFVGAGSDNYHLTAGSAARNSATGPSPSADRDGVARTAPADRGAYEYVA